MDSPPPLIRAQGLHKRYGSVHALRGLEVEVPHGTVGLLGPNGAGKTTLLKLLLGLLEPDEGTATVVGLDPRKRTDRLAIRTRVGYMPEGDCLLPETTAVELVSTLGRLTGLSREDAMTRAHEVLDYCQLEEARYRPVKGYSTGMKQRLKLAQALVHDPSLVLLDEPTNGLDPKGRRQMLDLVADLGRTQGKTVLLCTHLLPDVERTCDHVVLLQAGTIRLTGSVAELTGADAFRVDLRTRGLTEVPEERLAACLARAEVTLETRGEESLRLALPAHCSSADSLFAVSREAGFHIEGLTPLRASLEQVFLEAVATAERAQEAPLS
ncbi:MAG: ABC transporter ATP-binding protein [Planctomycetes bacterium]|nr:ABC transporter ATP-binding protein [Planctomycetota bacterium]MDA0948108.1 ABC transporter ATP-binding protein [Planctomycetota bacterium]